MEFYTYMDFYNNTNSIFNHTDYIELNTVKRIVEKLDGERQTNLNMYNTKLKVNDILMSENDKLKSALRLYLDAGCKTTKKFASIKARELIK